jgi:hypothetical protein
MKIFGYRYLPLNIYVGYSIFVLSSLFLGPMKYKDLDYFILVSFVSVLVLLFWLGYVIGAHGEYRQRSNCFESRSISYRRIKPFLAGLLAFGVISSIAQWYSFFDSGGGLSLSDIGDSYVKGYEGYERGQAKIDFFYILNIIDQALAGLVLLFSFYYFRVMGGAARYAFLFVVATYLLINVVGTGKQKYLGDVVIFGFFCMIIDLATKGQKFKLRTLAAVAVGAVFVFIMFVEVLRQRYSAAGIGLDNIYEKTHPLITWDDGALVLGLVSSDYALALGVFLSYFTSGLYGLYLSLTLPFEWTYFVGNSYSLGRIVEIVFSADGAILKRTYPYRVDLTYGWGFDKWHSLFSWLASDITFFGILLFTPLFSFLYARLWLEAIRASNPFAGPLFIYLSLGLIFSFANNQIMHGLAGAIVLVVLLAGWVLSRILSRQHRSTGMILVAERRKDE